MKKKKKKKKKKLKINIIFFLNRRRYATPEWYPWGPALCWREIEMEYVTVVWGKDQGGEVGGEIAVGL